ncbi:MAG: hypothetical protein COA80_17495 [Leeuwenhoekiella sp.]|nr:MAG: hypothetical protein COA80_17495 [Leeuwenhoekiella sp.]
MEHKVLFLSYHFGWLLARSPDALFCTLNYLQMQTSLNQKDPYSIKFYYQKYNLTIRYLRL